MKRTDQPFFNEDQKKLIREHLLKDAPEFEVERFIMTCERTGLDCFSRQIYGRVQNKKVMRGGREEWIPEVVIITSIDGLRAVAERSNEYRGQTHPEWWGVDLDNTGKAGWQQVWLGSDRHTPDAARVGVYRQGFVEPVYGVARYLSYVQYGKGQGEKRPNPFWSKMPDVMLSKCAEANALRKAFPLMLSGIYLEEEIRHETDGDNEPQTEPEKSPDALPTLPTDMKPVEKCAPPPEPLPAAPLAPVAAPTKPKATKKPKDPSQESPFMEPTPAAQETPAPSTPAATSSVVREAEYIPPVEEETEPAAGNEWEGYVISCIANVRYNGRKLSTFTLAELDTIKASWVDKHAEKIAQDPKKQKEAAMVTEAWTARHAEQK